MARFVVVLLLLATTHQTAAFRKLKNSAPAPPPATDDSWDDDMAFGYGPPPIPGAVPADETPDEMSAIPMSIQGGGYEVPPDPLYGEEVDDGGYSPPMDMPPEGSLEDGYDEVPGSRPSSGSIKPGSSSRPGSMSGSDSVAPGSYGMNPFEPEIGFVPGSVDRPSSSRPGSGSRLPPGDTSRPGSQPGLSSSMEPPPPYFEKDTCVTYISERWGMHWVFKITEVTTGSGSKTVDDVLYKGIGYWKRSDPNREVYQSAMRLKPIQDLGKGEDLDIEQANKRGEAGLVEQGGTQAIVGSKYQKDRLKREQEQRCKLDCPNFKC